MKENFELYTDAIATIERGWTQRQYKSTYSGSYCLAGALAHVGGQNHRRMFGVLEPFILDDVHRRLRWSPMYWLGRCFGMDRQIASRQAGLEFWNDCPWRRKKTVLKVLKKLAKQYEPVHIDALTDQRNQLMIEVTNLRSQVTALRERVATAENENAFLWNRLFNTRHLEADQANLAQLETELETKWQQLQTLETI